MQEEILNAKIIRPDCFGKVRIPFSDKISTKDIKLSDINSYNTDIRIIPFCNPISDEDVNLTKYDLTWNATQLTEQELEI